MEIELNFTATNLNLCRSKRPTGEKFLLAGQLGEAPCCLLQEAASVVVPSQSEPPYCLGGFVQDRERETEPV